jgi:hypothetical protein
MVSWRLASRSKRPNRDPWGRAEAHFADGSKITLVYRGADSPEWERTRCKYAYSINQPKVPRTVAADVIRSGAGEGIDFTRALGALVSFLGADAERYESAQRRDGTHPDGEPVEAVCQWAAEHVNELDQLALDLADAVARERGGAAEASAKRPTQTGSHL